jgi:predicted transcriptional regulator
LPFIESLYYYLDFIYPVPLSDISPISEIFTELASETRCAILTSLDKRPARVSSLARELEITVQDVFRNINRLSEAGFVRRGTDTSGSGAFQLTELGRLVVKQIPYFVVLNKYHKLFEDHTFTDIPKKFVQRIGVLQNCEVIENVTPVLEKLKKLESGAREYLKIMVSQAWPEEGRILTDRAMNNVDVWTIIGGNTVFPREVIENVRPNIIDMQRSGKIKGKMLEKVNIALYISDSQSAIMLPNMKGEVDMSVLLFSADSTFNEWCLDIFNHMWEQAGPEMIDKTRII